MIAISTQEVLNYKFWLSGKVVPKARPRFHGGNITLPRNYRAWKNKAYIEILSQLRSLDIFDLLIQKAQVEMLFQGSHRGDLDNLAGAVLDLLTKTKIIIDDRVSCVSRLVIEHEPVGRCGAWVEVKPLTTKNQR